MISLITDRDKEIVKHCERYGFITLEQTQKCFIPDKNCSYQIASRRLLQIRNAGYINVLRDKATNCNVYVYKDYKNKPPSAHRIKVLDVYAELIKHGCKIVNFEIEKFWHNGKIRSDGFAIFTFKDRRYHFFIEVQMANNYHNLEKYDQLYKTGEVQSYLHKDHFPRVLFISDTDYDDFNLRYTKVVQLGLDLSQFATIFI